MAIPPATIPIAQFRADFPEFSDTTKYPNSGISFWQSLAGVMLNTGHWPTTPGQNGESFYDVGTSLFVAHNLFLEQQALERANLGGPPGVQTGALASVATGGASVSYDPSVGIVKDAGHWNLSIYGTRFLWLSDIVGTAPIMLGVGMAPPNTIPATGAWPGPWPWPSASGFSS
jgi:hypothetical protein